MGGRRVATAEIVAALELAGGRVYLAADLVPCDPDTIYQRLSQSKAAQEALTRARGRTVDRAEDALEKAVAKGEAWAVCFTLKTLGKARGYAEDAAPAPPPAEPLPRLTRDQLGRMLQVVAPPTPPEDGALGDAAGEPPGPLDVPALGSASLSGGPLAG